MADLPVETWLVLSDGFLENYLLPISETVPAPMQDHVSAEETGFEPALPIKA